MVGSSVVYLNVKLTFIQYTTLPQKHPSDAPSNLLSLQFMDQCSTEEKQETKTWDAMANVQPFTCLPLYVLAECLQAGPSRDQISVGARFSAPVQTGPEAHPASCTTGTGSFPGVRRSQGVKLTPHPLLGPRSKIE